MDTDNKQFGMQGSFGDPNAENFGSDGSNEWGGVSDEEREEIEADSRFSSWGQGWWCVTVYPNNPGAGKRCERKTWGFGFATQALCWQSCKPKFKEGTTRRGDATDTAPPPPPPPPFGGGHTGGDRPGNGSTHTGGGYTAGGYPMNGLTHGYSTDHAQSSDTENLYKCYCSDENDDSTCFCTPCSEQEINSNAQHGLCQTIEDCEHHCHDDYDNPGYRCIIQHGLLQEVMAEGLTRCQKVYGALIDFQTMAQCQDSCNGFQEGDSGGYSCVPGLVEIISGDSKRYCTRSESGEYHNLFNCREDCGK